MKMMIKLNHILDQNGKQVFKENKELELPTQPYLKLGEDFKVHFYGDQPITRELSYGELKNFGYVIVAGPVPEGAKYWGRQKEYYMIRKQDELKDQETILAKLPSGILIIHDAVNSQLRLEGRGTSSSGKGRWIKL